jgi:hypothetical protein
MLEGVVEDGEVRRSFLGVDINKGYEHDDILNTPTCSHSYSFL